ncbi:hypothetical protein N9R48_03120 [Rickettsiales bacterium]|nr:hypothetical protein [Rickettsiales bacterium]
MKISEIITKILLFFVKIYRFFFESKDEIQEKYYSQKNHEQDNYYENKEDSNNILSKYDEELDKNNVKKNKAEIRPESHHQRNLSIETGGLEAQEQKNIKSEDIWDDRSEEVDRMGTEGGIKSINTTAKRSMLWRLKRKRLDKEKDEISDKMEIAQEKKAKMQDRIKNNKDNPSGRSL